MNAKLAKDKRKGKRSDIDIEKENIKISKQSKYKNYNKILIRTKET
ncbi:hypothetical protein [Flavobacterium sp.]|nr:hypothetical protein [Flavobacterium sp.]MDI1316471.1 hypothetical protein [Flavobacterium sp.]